VGNAHPQAKGLSVSGGRQTGNPIWTQSQGVVTPARDVELEVSPGIQGAYTRERFTLGLSGKVLRG
jgi:hypothetical protein